MTERVREWLRNLTIKPCEACGAPVPVKDYRETGRTRPGTVFTAGDMELACPRCGATFWVRR